MCLHIGKAFNYLKLTDYLEEEEEPSDPKLLVLRSTAPILAMANEPYSCTNMTKTRCG